MRRGILFTGGTYRFTVECFDSTGANVAQTTPPTVVVAKNGTPNLDAVTKVDRNSDGKIYDCSYTPSGAIESDHYELRVTATTASGTYVRPTEHFDVIEPMRGTDDAYTGEPPTLEEIQENALFVLPISYQQQSQLQGAWIRRAIGDASPMELRALKDANGTALDLSGKTLKLYIMTSGKTPTLLQTILNADLTVFGDDDSVRFTPSSTVVGTVQKLLLSLRVVTTTEQEIVPGGIEIYRTAWSS